MNKLKKFLSAGILTLSLGAGLLAWAGPVATACDGTYDPNDPFGVSCGNETGLTDTDPRLVVAKIIRVALGILGILATVLVLYAGFKWMTAGGNEENAKSAQKILFSAVIGLIIILSAYAISTFVLNQLVEAVNG
jgi:hypothetical protein